MKIKAITQDVQVIDVVEELELPEEAIFISTYTGIKGLICELYDSEFHYLYVEKTKSSYLIKWFVVSDVESVDSIPVEVQSFVRRLQKQEETIDFKPASKEQVDEMLEEIQDLITLFKNAKW